MNQRTIPRPMVIDNIRRRAVWGLIFGCFMFLTEGEAKAQFEMWQNRKPQMMDSVSDLKARRVGDIITVFVSENTDVNRIDNSAMNRTHDASASLNGDYAFGGDVGAAASNGAGAFQSSSSRSNAGDASFTTAHSFVDRFSAEVVDVLPNGNLVISGKRKVVVDGDLRTIKLSGIVRGFDIRNNNSVQSHLIANQRLAYESNESAQKFYTRQGWLGRRVNRLWPF